MKSIVCMKCRNPLPVTITDKEIIVPICGLCWEEAKKIIRDQIKKGEIK